MTTLLALKKETEPNTVIWSCEDPHLSGGELSMAGSDPTCLIRISFCLDNKRVDMARNNTRPSNIPWGFERMSRESVK